MVIEPAQPACDRRGTIATVAYAVLLGACTAFSLTWLAVGAVVGIVAHDPSFAAALATAAAEGDRWALGILAGLPRSVPAAQALLDYGFSLASIVIAVVLITGHWQTWSTRLLVLAMFGSAGAFNLQAHAASVAVGTAIGLQIGMLHQVLRAPHWRSARGSGGEPTPTPPEVARPVGAGRAGRAAPRRWDTAAGRRAGRRLALPPVWTAQA